MRPSREPLLLAPLRSIVGAGWMSVILMGCSQRPDSVAAPEPLPPSAPHSPVPAQPPQAASHSAPKPSTDDIQVVGVVVANTTQKMALIGSKGHSGAQLVPMGATLRDKVQLIDVQKDHVLLSVDGHIQRVDLSDEHAPAGPGQGPAISVPSPTQGPKPLPPGMIPMPPDALTRPSSNEAFRDMLNRRSQQGSIQGQ